MSGYAVDTRQIGDRLRAELAAAGMTQRELADAIHIDPAMVSRLVSGRMQRPSLELLCGAADVLRVSVDRLLGRGAPASPDPINEEEPLPPSTEGGDWRRVALALAESDRIRAEAESKRADTEHARVTEVNAVMQRTIYEILSLHREDRATVAHDAPHSAGRSEPPARRARAGAGA